jgi:hypothetical protein
MNEPVRRKKNELYRWDDPTTMARVHQEIVQKTLAEAIGDVHDAAHEATIKAAERIITRTQGIQNEKLFEVAAAQGNRLMEQVADIYQQLALHATQEMVAHAKRRLDASWKGQ